MVRRDAGASWAAFPRRSVGTIKYIYLTVVGDEDQTSAFGVGKGWYVAEMLSDKEADYAIDAFSKFTALYNR